MKKNNIIEPGKWFVELDENGRNKTVLYDASYRRLLGYETEEEYLASGIEWEDRIHPEDAERVREYADWYREKHPENPAYDIEYRIMTKNGYRWFHDHAFSIRLEDGTLVKTYGVVFDVQDTVDREETQRALRENVTRFFALEDDFESLYDVEIATGAYTTYIKSEFYRSNVSDKLVTPTDYFQDIGPNIETVIYPEDREAMKHILSRETMLKALSENDHVDHYYRIVTGNGPIWFKLRIVYKDADRKNVIIGVFRAAEEMAARERKERERSELIAQMAGGIASYIVDPETGRFRILSHSVHPSEHYAENLDFKSQFADYVERDVYEPDKKTAREAISLPAMVSHLEKEKEYVFRYRDTSSGLPRWYEMRALKLSGREILFGFSDKDNEIIGQLLFERMRDSYFGLYYIDLDNGLARIIKSGHPEITGEPGSVVPYSGLMRNIAGASAGRTGKFFNKYSDIGLLKKAFAKEDTAYYTYKSFVFAGERWVTVTGLVLARRADRTPYALAMGFSQLDEDEGRNREAQEKLEESMQVVGGLATEYTALYHVDLSTGTYVPYHIANEIEDIRPFYESAPRFVDLVKAFANSTLVRPEDRETLLELYPSNEGVRKALTGKKKISALFKRNYGGEYLWTEVSIIKCEDESEKARSVIVGFEEKDREVRERSEHFREAEEAERLLKNIVERNNLAYSVDMSDDSFRLLRMDSDIVGNGMSFDTFSQAKEFFLTQVAHPDDTERLRRALDYGSIRKVLETVTSFSTEYRAIIDGISVWHEMIVTSLGKDEIAVGFAVKDAEIIQQHLEEKRYAEYLALFAIDLDTAKIKPLKTSDLFKTAPVGKAVPYKRAMQLFSALYAGEAKAFFDRISDLAYLKKEFATDDKRTFSYRSARLGENKWIEVTGYIIDRHEDGRPAMLTLGFSVADALATANKELQSKLREEMQMVGGLASEYQTLYYVNIEDRVFKIYSKNGETFDEYKQYLNPGADAMTILHTYGSSSLIHPDDRHLFAELTMETLRTRLAHSKRFGIRFRRNFAGEYRWAVMDVIKSEEINEPVNAVTIGFADRDAEIRSEQALNRCFAVLGKDIPPAASINELLSIAGGFYAAERCYIFEYGQNKTVFSNTYEWCAPGIKPMISLLQYVPTEEIAGWIREFERYGAFYMDTLDVNGAYGSEEGRALLEMQGISSLIAAPLMNGSEIVGFIGVDNPAKAKKNLEILKNVAVVAYSEILQRKENDEEHITLTKLTDAFVSVYYTDLSTDYMRTWKIDEKYKEAYGKTEFYSVSMGGYVRQNIAERDRERCMRMTSPEYVREQFRTKDRFSIGMTDIMLGYERDVVFDYIKVSEDGERLVICCRDVTETLKKEKEQQQQLLEARNAALTASKSKTDFLFNMSHDIRTPMNAITGFTNMAIKHVDNREKTLECLSKIQSSGNMLLSLINSVLEVSRIESGHATLDRQPGDVYFSFVSIESTLRELAEAKDIKLTFEYGTIRDRYVYADFNRCVRIFVNVISNAVKYTNEGGRVKVRCEQLGEAENGVARYRYTVEDNGIGMSEEFQKHVFEQFSREKTATVSGIQGTGLGMAVVKSFVDLMGGTITVKSKQGEGSTFTIDLPFMVQENKQYAYTDPVTGEVVTFNGHASKDKQVALSGKCVLLVEDNDLNCEIATEILEEAGLMVEDANDGTVAVEMLREKGPDHYDVILMDIQMPVMNGYEATKAIRAMYPDKHIPIIALSANAFAEDKAASLAAGMDDHVAKPINTKELFSALAKFIH